MKENVSNRLKVMNGLYRQRISRRQALKAGGIFTLGLAAAGCASKTPEAEETQPVEGPITVVAWGGDSQDKMRDIIFTPFLQDTGIQVIDTSTPHVAKIKAQVDSGNIEWDCVYTSLNYFYELGPDYFEPIDYSSWPQAQVDAFPEGSKNEYAVGGSLFAIVNTYRTDVFPTGEHPTNWSEFFDAEKFPGPRTIYASSDLPSHTIEHALQADGLALDEVYPLDNDKLDRAFAVLDKIKPHVVSFYRSGAAGIQLMANKEAVLGNFSNGTVHGLMQDGIPLAMDWTGGTLNADFWLILKGTKNLEAAQKFVQYASTAEKQAEYHSLVPYGPANIKALELIDEEWRVNLPSAHLDELLWLDLKWWGDHRQEVTERFLEWVTG